MSYQCVSAPAAIFTEIDGVSTRLCSVVDNQDTGIRVFLQKVTNLEDGTENLPIEQEHISAYPNEASGTVHIHLTHGLNHSEVIKVDRSLVASRNNGDFAAAILARTVTHKDERPVEKKKAKYGNIVLIPPYATSFTTLVCCMSFALTGASFPDLAHKGISLVEINGSKMSLGMYYTYLNIISSFRGATITNSTSFPRVNGGETLQLNPSGPLPHPVSGLAGMVELLLSRAIAYNCEMLKADFGSQGIDVDELFPTIVNTAEPFQGLFDKGQRNFQTLSGPMTVHL